MHKRIIGLVNAVGDDLEVIGNLYSVRRVLGDEDETLRRNIRAEISRRNSEGTPNSVKTLLSSSTGLKNMRVFEHSTGCPIIYGETTDQSYMLSGFEAQYVKDAAPITTGSCVFGVSYSDQYSNAIIPAELDLTYYNLVAEDGGEYKNVVTGAASVSKNIVVRKSSDSGMTSSADSQNAQLAEFTTTSAQLSVDVSSDTQDQLSMNTAGNILQVSFEGIENDRGVPIQTTQITINSTVEQIIAAFNEVAP